MAFDRAAAKAAGYSDQEIDTFLQRNGTPVKAHFRVTGGGGKADAAVASPAARPDPSASLGGGADFPAPDTSAAGYLKSHMGPGPDWGGVARAVGPSIAGGAASAMLGPEVGLPIKMLLSSLAGAGTDAGVQMARGQTPDASSLVRGGIEGGATGVGGLLEKLMAGLGRGWMGTALSRGVHLPQQTAAEQAAARALGRSVEPSEVSFADQAIKERAPVGKPIVSGRSGLAKVQGRLDATTKAHDALVASSPAKPVTRQAFTGAQPFADLKAEVTSEGDNSATKLASLDKMARTFLDEGRPTASAPYPKLAPEQVLEQKRYWQGVADNAHAYALDNKTPISLRGRFASAIAKAMREHLETLSPDIAPLNRRSQALMPLRDVLRDADRADVMHPTGAPTGVRPNLNVLDKLNPMAHPRVSSRAALAVTHPAVKGAAGQIPRGAETLLQLLDGLSKQEQH